MLQILEGQLLYKFATHNGSFDKGQILPTDKTVVYPQQFEDVKLEITRSKN